MSRVRLYGSSKGIPFQDSTMTFEEEPIPMTNLPGAASHIDAMCCAINAGPLVYAGMIATPSRMVGAHWDAKISGVKPSVPSASELHKSVYPKSANSLYSSCCSLNGASNGTVIP